MPKFYVLQRDFMARKPREQFDLQIIEAKGQNEAWEKVEAEISSTNSQEWLMNAHELSALKRLLK